MDKYTSERLAINFIHSSLMSPSFKIRIKKNLSYL